MTSPLRPAKPPRTEIRQYSWRNSTRKEVCMYIRMLKPLEIRKEKEELKFKSQESTNCPYLSDVIVSGVTVASPLLPSQKADGRNTQSSLMLKGTNSSEIGLGDHRYQYLYLYLYTLAVSSSLGGSRQHKRNKQKQWGFHSVLPAMTRDPAEFGWHCWSNTTHPPPSSTTYVAS